MSLDNIQLPLTIIQSLYSRSLYDLNTGKSDSGDLQTERIGFLGSNEKKIAILVNSAEAIYLPDEELNFLLGILTACRLTMADIALINVSKNPELDYAVITDQLKAEKLLLLGLPVETIALPLQFPHYQIQNYNNQVYLSSESLSTLQKDKEEKLKLWNCLKKIFSL
jgi:hypothetical protein